MFYDGKMTSSDAFYFGETPDTLAATGKAFTLPNKKRANAFLYPYGYLASRKEGICSMDGTVTPDIPESKKKFLMESGSRGREL